MVEKKLVSCIAEIILLVFSRWPAKLQSKLFCCSEIWFYNIECIYIDLLCCKSFYMFHTWHQVTSKKHFAELFFIDMKT